MSRMAPAAIPIRVGRLVPAAGNVAGVAVTVEAGELVGLGELVIVGAGELVAVDVAVEVAVAVAVDVAVLVAVDVAVEVAVAVFRVNTSCVQELSSGTGVFVGCDVFWPQLSATSTIPPQSDLLSPSQFKSNCHLEQISPSPFSKEPLGGIVSVPSWSWHTCSSQQSRSQLNVISRFEILDTTNASVLFQLPLFGFMSTESLL